MDNKTVELTANISKIIKRNSKKYLMVWTWNITFKGLVQNYSIILYEIRKLQ